MGPFDIETKLTASDAAPKDFFGRSVGISGDIAIVGSAMDDDSGSGSGSAYLFDVTTGKQLAKLTASDGAAGNGFGTGVGISRGMAIVGAIYDDDRGVASGSAYLFDVTTGKLCLDRSGLCPCGVVRPCRKLICRQVLGHFDKRTIVAAAGDKRLFLATTYWFR